MYCTQVHCHNYNIIWHCAKKCMFLYLTLNFHGEHPTHFLTFSSPTPNNSWPYKSFLACHIKCQNWYNYADVKRPFHLPSIMMMMMTLYSPTQHFAFTKQELKRSTHFTEHEPFLVWLAWVRNYYSRVKVQALFSRSTQKNVYDYKHH